MKQFSQNEMQGIRERLHNFQHVIHALEKENAVVLEHPLIVQKTALATWNHYYYCPQHGMRLEWRYDSPKSHRCPEDGHLFHGEPYDGAWWRWLNGLNAKACQELGLLWQLTGEQRYLEKVSELLLTYARYYPDYQEHGGIPCNGPGKANAQTLCEANCHLQLALGYDFIRDALSAEQCALIETRLLREGAEFLMHHRHDQLHNHEVKISATLGVIGAIIGEPRYLNFAVNSPYGLRYQLEHALLPGGLWFEGSLHYHFYALQGFFAFEKLAKNTPYSLISLPFYRQMLTLPLALLMPDGATPRLNDCTPGQEKLTQSDLYEFAYQYAREPLYAEALHIIYQHKSRENLDALLYGVKQLPPAQGNLPAVTPFHAPGTGLTIMRNAASQRALLVKHTPYGGEHDHYDRLGILLFERGHEIFPDLGTTGYGVPLHEGYYKNSATHNTVCISQANQPPATPRVLQWHVTPKMQYLDVCVDWLTPVSMPDSFTQIKWNSAAYQDVFYRRRLLMTGDLILDVTQITNPHRQQVDWTLHVNAKALSAYPSGGVDAFPDGPLQRMTDIRTRPLAGVMQHLFATQAGGFSVWLYGEGDVFQGKAPGNPPSRSLSYLIARSHQPQILQAALYDLSDKNPLERVTITDDGQTLKISALNKREKISISLSLGEENSVPEIIITAK
ncbi:alginate lyase [Rahnella sp. AA]|uniref:heparinase II/III domain-containing protein n=1 Tax=Rahnella sp. AA TaxID=2057180 RepID=UPI000C3486E1|nr:heparinase II/III family protein [Rahnella sp. AA]PKE27867.1 alginate lyase [Rahnella sp. AA]